MKAKKSNRAERSAESCFIEAILNGNAEEVETFLAQNSPLPAAVIAEAEKALPKIVNRSVWHRPQYHRIAKAIVAAGVKCTIWDAARVGLLDKVKELVTQDPALLNAADDRGRTALQRAALVYGSHAECVQNVLWLLSQGAVVDIFTASTFGMTDVVRAALATDPGIVHQKAQGSTALNWAVRPRCDHDPANAGRALEICRLLIEAGAKLDTTDDFEDGMQPLHHVTEWGNEPALAGLLIDSGANLDAKADSGWTPLDYAVDRDRKPMIAFLKSRGAGQTLVDWPNTFGTQRDLLLASAQRGDLEATERLLKEVPGIATARESNGATALHWAAHNGFYEVAELLIKNGADVGAQETNLWGGTPLHWASERQAPLVELLLRHGADINSRNCRTGQTPLHYCARCDDVPEVAELLIRSGAEVNARDNAGRTPLDYAEQATHQEVAGVLSQSGGVKGLDAKR